MPNVLKAGKLPEKVADIYRGTCKSCGAIVEFGVDGPTMRPMRQSSDSMGRSIDQEHSLRWSGATSNKPLS